MKPVCRSGRGAGRHASHEAVEAVVPRLAEHRRAVGGSKRPAMTVRCSALANDCTSIDAALPKSLGMICQQNIQERPGTHPHSCEIATNKKVVGE